MSRPPDPASTQWHLDKRIPVVLLFAFVVQTGAIVWWAATQQSNIEQLARTIAEIKEYGSPITRDRLTVLEQKTTDMAARTASVEAALDRLSNKIDILIVSKQEPQQRK